MAEHVHIASLLLQIMPESMSELQLELAGQPGVEVRAQSPQGKLVVVLETDQHKRILDFQASLHDRPGVLSCNLVYHEVVNSSEADQLMEDTDISAD